VGDLSPLLLLKFKYVYSYSLIHVGSNAGNPGLEAAQTHCGGTSSPEKVALK
jgi:hypothetical protein